MTEKERQELMVRQRVLHRSMTHISLTYERLKQAMQADLDDLASAQRRVERRLADETNAPDPAPVIYTATWYCAECEGWRTVIVIPIADSGAVDSLHCTVVCSDCRASWKHFGSLAESTFRRWRVDVPEQTNAPDVEQIFKANPEAERVCERLGTPATREDWLAARQEPGDGE